MVKLASWNVNSIKARLPILRDWLESFAPDVVMLQELKCQTEAFPLLEVESLGYHAAVVGQKTYNGVAVVSRTTQENHVTDFPGFEDPQRRILAATIDGVRVVNLYVPNGHSVGSEKYEYKLGWLDALHGFLEQEHGKLQAFSLSADSYNALFGEHSVDETTWYLVDPAGWVMMSYNSEVPYKDVISDLKFLLKNSGG